MYPQILLTLNSLVSKSYSALQYKPQPLNHHSPSSIFISNCYCDFLLYRCSFGSLTEYMRLCFLSSCTFIKSWMFLSVQFLSVLFLLQQTSFTSMRTTMQSFIIHVSLHCFSIGLFWAIYLSTCVHAFLYGMFSFSVCISQYWCFWLNCNFIFTFVKNSFSSHQTLYSLIATRSFFSILKFLFHVKGSFAHMWVCAHLDLKALWVLICVLMSR